MCVLCADVNPFFLLLALAGRGDGQVDRAVRAPPAVGVEGTIMSRGHVRGPRAPGSGRWGRTTPGGGGGGVKQSWSEKKRSHALSGRRGGGGKKINGPSRRWCRHIFFSLYYIGACPCVATGKTYLIYEHQFHVQNICNGIKIHAYIQCSLKIFIFCAHYYSKLCMRLDDTQHNKSINYCNFIPSMQISQIHYLFYFIYIILRTLNPLS
jgi:hypothetical protein